MNEEFEAPQDDTVVGKAIVLSLVAVILLAVAAAVIWWLNREPPPAPPPPMAETELAGDRELPPLQIPTLTFTEITDEAGLDFVHENGAGEAGQGEKLLPETMSGGGAFFDFDADGDQDLLCINSDVWPWNKKEGESSPTSALYENDGRGQFTNISEGSGLDITLYGNGVACGDYDNDGLVDVYVTAIGADRLFHNEGGGKFKDVTAATGIKNESWGTSCGWFDYDRDGDLDLMIANYIEWSREKDLSMEFTLDGTLRAYGRPTDFRGVYPVLYRNDGDGQFTDVSEAAGIRISNPNTGEPLAKSLGIVFADVDGDDWLDVVLANDTVQNLLLINQKDGTFQENAATSGIAFDNNGNARGAMGIDAGYFRNSDAIGVTIGNFANEMTALYVCQTPGFSPPIFRDEAVSNGIGPVTRIELTFGIMFADLDLDGRLDIFACNGHLEEDIQKVQASQHYEQPPQILWNCGPEYDNEFMVVPHDKTGEEFAEPMVGRGAARADIDGDGDLDLILFACGGRPRLLRNDQSTEHHWLRMKLTGTTSNRDAIGAKVKVVLPDGTVQTRVVMPTSSYQSQSELPVTFGLGEHQTVQSVTITWPDGDQQQLEPPPVDQLIEVTQPKAEG